VPQKRRSRAPPVQPKVAPAAAATSPVASVTAPDTMSCCTQPSTVVQVLPSRVRSSIVVGSPRGSTVPATVTVQTTPPSPSSNAHVASNAPSP